MGRITDTKGPSLVYSQDFPFIYFNFTIGFWCLLHLIFHYSRHCKQCTECKNEESSYMLVGNNIQYMKTSRDVNQLESFQATKEAWKVYTVFYLLVLGLLGKKSCCGLNIFVSPKFVCWSMMIFAGVAFGGWLSYEGRAFMNGISGLIRGDMRWFFFLPCEGTMRKCYLWTR